MARIVRLGRMYKIIKMTKLLRILKIVKERSKLLKYLNDILKIGLGFERLVFFVMIFFIMAHIVSCVWVIVAQLNAITDGSIDEKLNKVIYDYTGTWMDLSADIPPLEL
jgi:hypothetical protein